MTFGVAFTALGLSLLWVAPTVNMVYILLAIGGIGIAAFHPQATAYAGALAEGRGMGTSIFLTGGNIGRALGPLALMYIPYHFGLDYLAWEMIPGLLMALFVPKVLRFEKELDLTASTRGTPSDAPQQQEAFWVVAGPRMLPPHCAFHYRCISNRHTHRFRNLFIGPFRRPKLLRSGSFPRHCPFHLRGINGHYVKRLAYNARKHLRPIAGLASGGTPVALRIITHRWP